MTYATLGTATWTTLDLVALLAEGPLALAQTDRRLRALRSRDVSACLDGLVSGGFVTRTENCRYTNEFGEARNGTLYSLTQSGHDCL